MSPRWFCVATLLLLTLLPATGSAYTLLDDDHRKLSLGGLTRVGWVFEGGSHTPNQEAFIQLARLSGSMQTQWGKAYIGGEAASGSFDLLDAFVEVYPTEGLVLRAGIFVRPTPADDLMFASRMPFVRRSMLRTFTDVRLPGAEVVGTLPVGTAELDLSLGWFMPDPAERALLPGGDGNYLSARALLDFENGLGLHLAYFGLMLADNAPLPSPDDPTGATLVQPVPDPHVIDVALMYWTDAWNLQAELMLAPNTQDASEELNWGAYVHGQYRLPLVNTLELGPGARYGVLRERGVLTQRVTLGATLFIDGHFLKFIPNYDLAIRNGEMAHTGWLTLHAGF
ncbi:hypothetical protein FRC98_04005 [Lujinxingia vulgaris]|uniref:Porin n=1 Tax=Lujinxingia vulgaris TaxID=2600176 RepID=A0A5C6XIS9_9DELT|nr:hypothetical protein [Lujinxingia vulgaris]TXD38070.1 hypothetical protein FRC98_04005 [Lujinxingia vulgaris]